ncbi:LYR motif-containing protein 2 [Chrysoperla carnea]|uniref:LYR motif-containing protein 2 n=1 Tax=Chrysoperla carnea TaxID=189513 RepID=UPI001D069FBE|nr:LYR motif-containing protein 2 [Chrysoperla carnea]
MKLISLLLNKAIKPEMDLKTFMRRQQVLKLYRDLFRTTRMIEDKQYKREIQDWIRRDFRAYQNLTDNTSINIYLTYGKKCLKELESSIVLAR